MVLKDQTLPTLLKDQRLLTDPTLPIRLRDPRDLTDLYPLAQNLYLEDPLDLMDR
jgi:hypothetical protein